LAWPCCCRLRLPTCLAIVPTACAQGHRRIWNGKAMDTAREQSPNVILEPTILHDHRQGLTLHILLEREHRHLQRVPAWISQLYGNVVIPLSVQEILQSSRGRGRQQSVQRDGR